jgi:hypothetical protein
MNLSEPIKITGDSPNAGGSYNPESYHDFPVDDKMLPWHQGQCADWQKESYAEYVTFPEHEGVSKVSTSATRIKIELNTVQSNRRRYHDWKGYDDIEPCILTTIKFNGRQVYEVYGYANSLLRHLLQVESVISRLQTETLFGWWQDKDIEKVWGRKVTYRGLEATIEPSDDLMYQGCMILHIPDWPDDDYFENKRVKVGFLDPQINWYGSPTP